MLSCKSNKELNAPDGENVQIMLKKGSCFGECPVYTFNIYEGGLCEFIGKMHTTKLGTYTKRIEKDVYKSLVSQFKEAEFENFEEMYQSDIPDLPLITIGFKTGKELKVVKGKRERPEVLHKLQFKLEKIAESNDGWTMIDDQVLEEKQGPKYDKSKIVLELKNGNQLSRWFNDMRVDHGIRILKKLDDDHDKWLISYNIKNYAPETIIGILREDSNVISADFLLLEESK